MFDSSGSSGGMGNPLVVRVGQVFTGIGVGCGVGVGIGTPIDLRGFPMGSEVSSIVNQLNSTIGGVSQPILSMVRRHPQLRNLSMGVGCGIGFGHGFGAGISLKPKVVQELAQLAQDLIAKLASNLPISQLSHGILPAGLLHAPMVSSSSSNSSNVPANSLPLPSPAVRAATAAAATETAAGWRGGSGGGSGAGVERVGSGSSSIDNRVEGMVWQGSGRDGGDEALSLKVQQLEVQNQIYRTLLRQQEDLTKLREDLENLSQVASERRLFRPLFSNSFHRRTSRPHSCSRLRQGTKREHAGNMRSGSGLTDEARENTTDMVLDPMCPGCKSKEG